MNKPKKTSWDIGEDGNLYIHDKGLLGLIDYVRQEAKQEGIEEAIRFMKGKVINMPVGSGIPLVVCEAQVIGWLTKEKKEGIK